MRLIRPATEGLACWAILASSTLLQAAPPDPLRLVPNQADLVIKVEEPTRVVDVICQLDLLQQVQKLDAVRESLASTNSRRFYQLVAYYEKQLGLTWAEAVDRLAGGGAVLAVKFGSEPAPTLLVIQARDEDLLHRFMKVTLEVAETELARENSKDRPRKGTHRQIETLHIGKEFHSAIAGSALLISNVEPGLHRALDLHLDGDKQSVKHLASLAEARQRLAPNPLAWSWINLAPVHQAPGAKDVYALPNDNPTVPVLFGAFIDLFRRSPFACAGLYHQDDTFALRLRLPSGQEGMRAELAAHLPTKEAGAALPLLEPKNVLYSNSFCMDVSKFWEHRARLLTPEQLKGLEDFDKNSGRFLAGIQFSKVLEQAGWHHRVVVTHQGDRGYQTRPGQYIPAFAYVVDTRDADGFGRSMAAILRAGALLFGNQAKLRLAEEQVGEVNLVGYRFAENVSVPDDLNNVRYNFSPCFARVGNQFFAASTLELGREMIGLLQQEARSGKKADSAAIRSRLYSAGVAELLLSNQDEVLTQTILDRALAPDEARQQVKVLIDLVRKLGRVELESQIESKEFRYDLQLKLRP